MDPLRRAVFRSWPLFAALAAGLMLAVAHGFQSFGGLLPCELCLKQRDAYWAAVAIGLAGFLFGRVFPRRHIVVVACALLTVVFLYEAGLAAYHAGVEWKVWPGPQVCTGGADASLSAINTLLGGGRISSPRCDVAAWRFLGLSMAGWNAPIALVLAVLSGIAALGRELTRGLDR